MAEFTNHMKMLIDLEIKVRYDDCYILQISFPICGQYILIHRIDKYKAIAQNSRSERRIQFCTKAETGLRYIRPEYMYRLILMGYPSYFETTR